VGDTRLVTVVFPLYNAAGTAAALVERLKAQVHPEFSRQSDWLAAVFADDCSRDGTSEAMRTALAENGNPGHYTLVTSPQNLGLAANLNRVFRQVQTPFVLTCHCDCLFGRDDYVAEAVALLRTRPRAAAICGKPALLPGRPLPFAEKLNLIANLMDILPEEKSLVPVGFAEGRCDAFRMKALVEVGFHDEVLRTSGEDQLLSAKLRGRGWEILKAPNLTYYLLASSEQNTVGKLLRHLHMFARTSPLIMSRSRAVAGIAGEKAGSNRRRRAALRLSQLLAAPCYAAAFGIPISVWFATPLALLLLVRVWLYRQHLRRVRPGLHELLGILCLQPVLDIAYALGFAQGLYYLWRRPAVVR
jgi:glycosyltransferase involved in cell wall biosynthesis